MFQETYLVLSATGRQGGGVVDALLAKNAPNVVGSSRNPESLRKKRGMFPVIQLQHHSRFGSWSIYLLSHWLFFSPAFSLVHLFARRRNQGCPSRHE